jgi:hypothetical protein
VTGTADQITADLAGWIRSILPDISVSVRSLGDKQRQPGVDLRLLRVAPRPGPRTLEPPSVANLDYLATVGLTDPAAEQRALGDLLFAAMDRTDVEVIEADDLVSLCARLGIAPAAGLILRTPLVREREVKPQPRVRAPLKVNVSEMGVIAGQVLGPGDVPIAGATVAAVGLNRFAQTDRDGQFHIRAAPGSQAVRLVARARGAEVQGEAKAGSAVTLRLPLEV